MFGSKKNQFDLRIREVFSQVAEQREGFDIAVAQMEEAGKRVQTDVAQVMENTNELSNHAMANIESETSLIYKIDEFSKELSSVVTEYKTLRELTEQHYETTMALVEENKHFTSPAKYLTEAPAVMKQDYASYEAQLAKMEEYGNKMSVMALNTAIEAGRLGEEGKQFVNSIEEIRQTAVAYEKAASDMQTQLQESREKVEKLEDTIRHLMSLIKENNIGTTRLLKKGQELGNALNGCGMREFSDDMLQMRDVLVGLRNMDEEIAKCGERNKIQLADIQEDVRQQKNTLAEVESDLSHILDVAEAQLK